ncbi:MAG: hypothetical protein LBU85_02000 [Treponema sp.]|jgi:hypothetical protein|nr:hypothetical protein [Treponema sp.]
MKKKPIQPNLEFRDNLGKLLLDMAKLTFASFILGGILKGELPQNVLIIAGCIVFVVFAVAGLVLTSRKKNRGNYVVSDIYVSLLCSTHCFGWCLHLA